MSLVYAFPRPFIMSHEVDPYDDFTACQDFVESYVFDKDVPSSSTSHPEKEQPTSEDSSLCTDTATTGTRRKRTKEEIRIAKNQRRNIANGRRRALILAQLEKQPSASRTAPEASRQVFPSFDKSDSMAFLPVSMIQYMNCGDFVAVRSLLAPHISTRCSADHDGEYMTVNSFIDVFECFQELCPDNIHFMREGKVEGNTICATVLTKYTETSFLYDGFIERLHRRFPRVFPMFSRRDRWMRKMNSGAFSVQDVINAMALIDQNKSLVVQGELRWTFTFSIATHKFSHLSSTWQLTSLAGVPELPNDPRSPL